MSRIDSFDPPEANPPVRRGRSRPPQGPGEFVLDSLRMAWRWLTRMKTALYLLGLLGLLTVLATVVPQSPNVPATVRAWRAGEAGPGRLVSSFIDVIGGYDVYGSPLFLALLLLLFLSLTACLIPRVRAYLTLARRGRPPLSRNLAKQPETATIRAAESPQAAIEQAREVLRRRRYRLRPRDDNWPNQVAAEKGIVSREGGSLLFHLSFYVLLVAVVLGQLLGFRGEVGVVEGEPGFSDTEIAYWRTWPGRWWGPDDHRAFTLDLDEFHIDWHRDPRFGGTPSLFLSDVTVTEADGDVRTRRIGGNDPMVVDGMKIHQLEWGYAPRVVVEADGEVVHDSFLMANRTDRGFYRTAVKAPKPEPDVGLSVAMYPFAPLDEDGTPTLTGAPWDDAPGLVLAAFRGDLRLDRVQNVNELDTEGLELVGAGFLPLGESIEIAEGVTVHFPELRRWVGFQVSYRPTVPYLLVGSLLLLVGLVAALYAYRRRVWIEAMEDPVGGGTLLTVAGRPFQRPQAFTDEFAEIVRELEKRFGGGADADGTPRPSPSRRPAGRHGHQESLR